MLCDNPTTFITMAYRHKVSSAIQDDSRTNLTSSHIKTNFATDQIQLILLM
jgi:hypothetical protein